MIYRVLVAAVLLRVALGDAANATKSNNAVQKQQAEQPQQKQQSKADCVKYVKQFVPKEFQGNALAGCRKDANFTSAQELSAQPSGGSGDYQKYMSEYASGGNGSQGGDWQKYMKQYAGGGQGGGQGGGYQQYMKQYAGGQGGDYQKYMKQYAGGQGGQGGPGGPSTKSQSSDYQQYMKQYAGGSQSGSQSQSGDYTKYMKQYAAASQGGSQSQSADSSKFMKKYIKGGSTLQMELLEKSADNSNADSKTDYQKYVAQYAGGANSGNQNAGTQSAKNQNTGDYSKYMKQYAGGANSGDYQQYMKQYAGGSQGGQEANTGDYQQYMKQYAEGYENYADYQKYMKRYGKKSNEEKNGGKDTVRSAHDAKNKTQLRAWRSAAKQNVQWYVPAQYATYADHHVEKQYKQRLHELNNNTDVEALPAILNLDAVPEHKKHLNATQLKEASIAGVQKAEQLGKSLKKAAADTKSIEEVAARPINNVASSFSKRSQALEQNIEQLQDQAKSGTAKANFTSHVTQAVEEVKSLRHDELQALTQAHSDAIEATRHSARGTQSEAREEARRVWAQSNKMARKDQSYQDLADKLQDRVENAADDVQNHGEDLARKTQDRLDDNLSNARSEVRKNADRRFDALQEVLTQESSVELSEKKATSQTLVAKSTNKATEHQEDKKATKKATNSGWSFLPKAAVWKAAAGSKTSLAESANAAKSSVDPLAVVTVVGGAFACLMFMFVAKRKSRTVQTPSSLLG